MLRPTNGRSLEDFATKYLHEINSREEDLCREHAITSVLSLNLLDTLLMNDKINGFLNLGSSLRLLSGYLHYTVRHLDMLFGGCGVGMCGDDLSFYNVYLDYFAGGHQNTSFRNWNSYFSHIVLNVLAK